MSISERLRTVAEWIFQSEKTVVFTGAGVSTESGLPDFRSPGGIWAKSQPVYFQEFVASDEARKEYWRQKSIAVQEFIKAKPNVAHEILANWEQQRELDAIITQNIDGLHQLAGSRRVWEVHGTAREAACLDCNKRFAIMPLTKKFLKTGEPPKCPQCGGYLKHATVSFGQMLPEDVLYRATQDGIESDLFIVLGSSLVVHPAADLPEMAHDQGARLVIINRDPTPLDGVAEIVLHQPIGKTLQQIDDYLTNRDF
ncbi:MAG: NAD-dependent deacylase [Planctomycetaceae bacterium]